jgi:formimidoylglutamate deiminase
MYRYLDRLGPDEIETIAAMVFMEMLEAGYAAVAEFHYLHHDVSGTPFADLGELSGRIVAAAQATGIGLTLLPVLYQWGGIDGRALAGGQLRFGNDPARYADLHAAGARLIAAGPDDYTIGVAPHSLRAVDAEGMKVALGLSDTGPIHMHLAEQVAEVEEIEAHTGQRPTQYLLDTQDVNDRWCLIHATQMNEAETIGLAKTGAVAGLCPITESSLGDGIFNGTQFVNAGGKVGFGSDSNIHVSYFDELRTLDYSQRLRDRSRAAMATADRSTGRVLVDLASVGGAQAAGRASGRIEAGQWADLLALSVDNPVVCNRRGDVALDTLIFGGQGDRCIRDVWSAGRHVISGGRHAQRDAISQRFQQVVGALGQDI